MAAAGPSASELMAKIIDNVERVVVGKRPVVEKAVVALMGGGHVLFEDAPGLGKTMLARAIAISIGGSFRRVQFTPDLLPTDITGVTVFNQKTGEFEFRPGPVFANVLLADEINRTSPRTQSALLEAMGEGRVTADGVTYRLPEPFLVLATQNPLETEGIYPLPESQMDRFMMRLSIGYPTAVDEKEIIRRQLIQHPIETLQAVCNVDDVLEARREVAQCEVSDEMMDYAVKLARATRDHPAVALGASPRGSIALVKAAQALAVARGRDFVVPDDIKELAACCLAHRLVLAPEARARGARPYEVIAELLETVPVPG